MPPADTATPLQAFAEAAGWLQQDCMHRNSSHCAAAAELAFSVQAQI